MGNTNLRFCCQCAYCFINISLKSMAKMICLCKDHINQGGIKGKSHLHIVYDSRSHEQLKMYTIAELLT